MRSNNANTDDIVLFGFLREAFVYGGNVKDLRWASDAPSTCRLTKKRITPECGLLIAVNYP